MKSTFFIILTIFSLSTFAQNGAKNFIDQNYIEVTGKSDMEIIPDELFFNIVIDEKDLNSKSSLDKKEKEMIRKLENLGIDISKKLTIKDMASNLRNYWVIGSNINAKKKYQLVLNDAKTAGQVFNSLESIDISNISLEKIDHSEIQKFKSDVKMNAIKAAKEKAESLTNSIGQQIGSAIYIQELNSHFFGAAQDKPSGLSNISVKAYNVSEKSAAEQEPEIAFEKIKLEYSILVRFELLN